MPRKIKRKGTSRNTGEQEKKVYVDELVHDPEVSEQPIRVIFDDDILMKVERYASSLRVSRGIKPVPDPNDIRVKFYRDRGYTMMEAVQKAQELYAADDQALENIVAMVLLLDDAFVVEKEGHITNVRLRDDFIDIEIPDDYWDTQEENILREESYLPPLPVMDKRNPVEMKVAYALQLFVRSPKLQSELLDIANRTYAVRIGEEADEDGFHSGDVGGDMDAGVDPDSEDGSGDVHDVGGQVREDQQEQPA